MATPEQLTILIQDVKAWNRWRGEDPAFSPDLSGASLHGADLSEANLSMVDLVDADLHWANLSVANLSVANFLRANLGLSNLSQADLSRANLTSANLAGADLNGANFSETIFGGTILGNVDLSTVSGLESARHQGPSTIGIDTFFRSKGKIPESFLRGAGVPDNFLQYAASLAGQPFEFYSCFISYSTKDEDLAKSMYADLQANGVRCWFAPEDLKIGDRFRTEIDRAIRVHDKLLLLLSANSVLSDWVEKEFETAFERERRDNRTILFPIRLDDAVMAAEEGWAADIRRTRHIGDFTKWKDHDAYQKAFDRLLRDLKASDRIPHDHSAQNTPP